MNSLQRTSLPVIIAGIIFGLAAAGCSFKYQKMEGLLATHGYSDVPLDDNSYRVTYTGAKGATLAHVDLSALYRCAELTVEKGYDYFVIVDRIDGSNVSTNVSNKTATGGPSPTVGFKGVEMVSTTTTTTTVSSSTQHTAIRTIRLFRGTKPADNSMAFDARQLLRNLDTEIEK